MSSRNAPPRRRPGGRLRGGNLGERGDVQEVERGRNKKIKTTFHIAKMARTSIKGYGQRDF